MSSRPLRVLHVITDLNTGGAERMLCRVATTGAAVAIEHHVVSLMGDGTLTGDLRAAGVPVTELGLRKGAVSPRGLAGLLRAGAAVRPHVVQGWMYHGNLAGHVVAARHRVPVLWNIRQSFDGWDTVGGLTGAIIAGSVPLSRRADRILYNSHTGAATHAALGFDDRRAVVIPNGFDTGVFAPNPAARARLRDELGLGSSGQVPLVLGSVARYHPVKGHALLLAACAPLLRSGAAQLVLAGKGLDPGNPELAGIIRKHGIAEGVHLLGPRRDVPAVMNALDVHVLSSLWGESFPNVVGEAMACAVPCVVTDVGDAARIVGETGWTVPRADEAALARALFEVAAMDPETLRARGRAARDKVVRDYALASIIERYAALYREVAA